MPNQFGQINVAIWFGKSNLVWQILFTSAIQFGNSVWQFSLAVLFDISVWQFSLAVLFGNSSRQFSLAIQFEFGDSVW
jgi:hypothetical protein